MLLTFTNIGKDVFPDAAKAMVNLGVAMANGDADAVDLQATAIQLGKALNDPVKGVTALTKVGVTFTEQQKDQIAAMVKAGDTAGAQRVILAELATEFGKAGEAAGTGYAADMRRFNDAIEGAQQAIAIGFLPVIQEMTKFLTEKLNDPKVLAAIKDLGTKGAGLLAQAFEAAKKIPWDSIANAFQLMGQGAKAAYDLFMGLPDWVKTAVLTGWGLNKLTGGAVGSIVSELSKGLIKGVLGMTAGIVNINAGTVNGGLGGAAGGGKAGLLGGATAIAGGAIGAALLTELFNNQADVIREAKLTTPEMRDAFRTSLVGQVLTVSDPTLLKGLGGIFGPGGSNIVNALLEKLGQSQTQTTTFGAPRANDQGLKGPTTVVPGPGFTEYMHNQSQQTGEQKDELSRIKQLAGDQLGVTTGQAAQQKSTAAQFVAKWDGIRAQLGLMDRHGEDVKRAIAKGLDITVKELEHLRHVTQTDIAHQLDISTQEFIRARRQAHGDDTKLAAKLGITVDELAAIREKARLTAANTNKIAGKNFSPTIKVTSNFNVSARTVVQATRIYRTQAGRNGVAVE
jgi:hypothetical protein